MIQGGEVSSPELSSEQVRQRCQLSLSLRTALATIHLPAAIPLSKECKA